ncbi:ComEA family DNA-binding protein [Sedimenticola selenatireducens]|uniref:Helix-hairpin-helix domain-containing protein n=1 Tax=Sedimenticola selenatireducens TaxID=191960 RepID=A0A557S4X0_9GAMM|nr:helix-hairpin-helix domain-containing protein [Sedimenticola selenatireducens]TVO72445.1 helix-hairpin-helix domain-containing protein [Sedimenticola selenatireducens]TVT64700.1 MAG: helix-hairpin-helix domain-containing protein [Sedimenticola selenatireducens]
MKLTKGICLATLLLASVGCFAAQVNVNAASAEEIAAELRGVGDSKAAAIVAYRTKNGAFKTADELAMVKGIGQKTVEANRDNILLSEPAKRK